MTEHLYAIANTFYVRATSIQWEVRGRRLYSDEPDELICVCHGLDKAVAIAIALNKTIRLIYEDELPVSVTRGEYMRWLNHSIVSEGVRMGPEFRKELNEQTD